jgi:GDP-4-dehydro-6-deoxy-D-mannose reductase
VTRRVLVTGATGLLGRALLARLQAQGADVVGISRSPAGDALVQADLTDAHQVVVTLERVAPTVVVHLAGSASAERTELWRANVVATRQLMQAVASMEPPPAVIVAGSAAEYGDPVSDRIGEDHPLRPVTEYGRTKAEQSTLVQDIASRAGLRACVIRPFNIVSPDLHASLALGNMRRQLLEGANRRRTVRCGRLDVIRDFIPLAFVTDTIVRLLELDEWPAILNVCSGVGVELGDLLDAMASELGVEVAVEVDPRLSAIPAAPRVVGDPTRLRGLGLESHADVDELAALLVRSNDSDPR